MNSVVVNGILSGLKEGNKAFVNGQAVNFEKIHKQRMETAVKGQNPEVVVIACSDSRVPPELIFSAGIGEMFVIRTAGNLVGQLEMESISYAVDHLGAPVVMILGHSYCGAVKAAKDGSAPYYLKATAETIKAAIGDESDQKNCELKNIDVGVKKLLKNELIKDKVASAELAVIGAYYCLETGTVEFL
ncbi:MAG: carbonic anhydrase [Eubacteriaceae bacterium]|jgi:carbonic anhydrase|nr:carbonic anhydrase [Eubacteriaceae bacterium]